MTRDEIQSAALALPAAERRELVEVLWESLEQDPEPTLEGQRQLVSSISSAASGDVVTVQIEPRTASPR